MTRNKCSRIDRIFVSWNFLCEWTNAEYRALTREESDHSPLILKLEARNFGPKPFRFFNSWLSRNVLEEVVHRALSGFIGNGPPDVVLMNKFRIRLEIVKWKQEWLKEDVEEEMNLKQDLFHLDELVEERDLTEAEEWVIMEAKKKLKELDDLKAKDIRQKARGVINKRRVANTIPGLSIDGRWVFKPAEVKKEVHRFFKQRFAEDLQTRPSLDCYGIKQLNDIEAE
ncbi:uncharacterized protein LOC118491579 [Helianthus annuus]|uniref:uncharacterized protein LOC118491579 n=1 Tax=Helianthus annuus TaxID=4232 RepID=UPI001652E996|nr:uncharacterized protein LOC118491579 [Helianthus annuus]